MRIEVETTEKRLPTQLLDADEPIAGAIRVIPGGAQIQYRGRISARGALPGSPELFEFVLTLASGASSSLIASWLYDKLRGGARTIRIDRTVIEITPEGLHRAVKEHISVDR